MTRLVAPRRLLEKISGRRRGWIGADVGIVGTKLAQLEKTDEGYRFVARWIVGSEDGDPANTPLRNPLAVQLPELNAARRAFRGTAVAAAVSSSLTALRLLSLPVTGGDELRAMALEELLADQDGDAELQSDVWPVDRTPRRDGLIRLMAVGIAGEVGDDVGRHLRLAGYDPRNLDATPHALARAVKIADRSLGATPLAAVDLGYSQALLTIVVDGKPTFCRTLRDCELRSMLQPLSERIGASLGECRQIVQRGGVPDDFNKPDRRQDLSYPLLSSGLERLAEELNRSFGYIRQELPEHRPEKICLFGGGALIKNLSQFLSRRCGLATSIWTLGNSNSQDSIEPLFGIAAGLSAAAWEN